MAIENPFGANSVGRNPSAAELLHALKNTAYTCASINAAICANHPPKLYVRTRSHQSAPKCFVGDRRKTMESQQSEQVHEVIDHPVMNLLGTVNPEMNGYDLLELTTMYQECIGSAFWKIETDAMGVPSMIWPLASQCTTPRRSLTSSDAVDYYEFRGSAGMQLIPPSEVIHFRYTNPRDPFGFGLSPMRAAFDQLCLDSDFVAFKNSIWTNKGLPGVVISPKEVISQAERERIEEEWQQRFSKGGQGKAYVSESALDVNLIDLSLGDLATLAEQAFSKEQIANAFGVPLAMLTKETNLANLQASLAQHAILTIRPRLKRRDEKLNERLIPFYDDSHRLFFASDDPADMASDSRLAEEKSDLETGVRTINEVRASRGLDPVAWGHTPWLPLTKAPTNLIGREQYAPQTGTNADPERNNNAT